MNSRITVAEKQKITYFVSLISSVSLFASNHFLTFLGSLLTIFCRVSKLSDSK